MTCLRTTSEFSYSWLIKMHIDLYPVEHLCARESFTLPDTWHTCPLARMYEGKPSRIAHEPHDLTVKQVYNTVIVLAARMHASHGEYTRFLCG